MYHLVFALHFHTFLWVLCSLLIVFRFIFPDVSFPTWLILLIMTFPVVYLSIAMRRFYQTTRWKAIWKANVITFLYIFLILGLVSLITILMLRILNISPA